jgi:hypothetical protein
MQTGRTFTRMRDLGMRIFHLFTDIPRQVCTAVMAASFALASSAAVGEPLKACTTAPIDPYTVWRDVSGPDEAERVLLRWYEQPKSPEQLAEWLRCQGFSVRVSHGPQGRRLKQGEVHIDAAFGIASDGKEQPLWQSRWFWFLQPTPWSQGFEVSINSSKKIFRLRASATYE